MFARSTWRCAGSARQIVRSYATEAPKGGSSSTPYIVGGLAVASGIGGYAFLGKNASADAPPTKKEAEKLDKRAFTGGDQGFIDLKLKESKDYNHNTKSFIFELPEADQVSGMNVTSAIITKFKAQDAEKPTIRPYTPTSDPDEKGTVELLVKKYANGPMSEHLHSMKPGETLSMKGPIPKYPWTANKHEHITCVAGGTGITPMYQLIKAIFKNPEDKTKVSLVFGNISSEDILLKEEFDKLEKDYPQRFKTFYTVDKPEKDWAHGKGFITKDLLNEVVPDPKSGNIKVFICGPPGLYKAVSGAKVSPTDQGELDGILKELGYSKDQVYKF